MKKTKLQAAIIIFSGLVCIGAVLFVYFFVDKTYPDSESSRVQNLNWLLNTFGRTGTSVLFGLIGLVAMYA